MQGEQHLVARPRLDRRRNGVADELGGDRLDIIGESGYASPGEGLAGVAAGRCRRLGDGGQVDRGGALGRPAALAGSRGWTVIYGLALRACCVP
jgi:hypothetical protein